MADQTQQLKTLKFTAVRVEGQYATAVCDYVDLGKNNDPVRIEETVTLRRSRGSWKICKNVVKRK